MTPRILRLRKLLARYDVSRSTIYKWMDEGTFPAPIKLGPRAVGWLESELDSFDRERIAERDGRTV